MQSRDHLLAINKWNEIFNQRIENPTITNEERDKLLAQWPDLLRFLENVLDLYKTQTNQYIEKVSRFIDDAMDYFKLSHVKYPSPAASTDRDNYANVYLEKVNVLKQLNFKELTLSAAILTKEQFEVIKVWQAIFEDTAPFKMINQMLTSEIVKLIASLISILKGPSTHPLVMRFKENVLEFFKVSDLEEPVKSEQEFLKLLNTAFTSHTHASFDKKNDEINMFEKRMDDVKSYRAKEKKELSQAKQAAQAKLQEEKNKDVLKQQELKKDKEKKAAEDYANQQIKQDFYQKILSVTKEEIDIEFRRLVLLKLQGDIKSNDLMIINERIKVIKETEQAVKIEVVNAKNKYAEYYGSMVTDHDVTIKKKCLDELTTIIKTNLIENKAMKTHRIGGTKFGRALLNILIAVTMPLILLPKAIIDFRGSLFFDFKTESQRSGTTLLTKVESIELTNKNK